MATIDADAAVKFESDSPNVQTWINNLNEEVRKYKTNIDRFELMAGSNSPFAKQAQERLDQLKGTLDTFTTQAKKATEKAREREEAAFNRHDAHLAKLAEHLAEYVQSFNKSLDVE